MQSNPPQEETLCNLEMAHFQASAKLLRSFKAGLARTQYDYRKFDSQ